MSSDSSDHSPPPATPPSRSKAEPADVPATADASLAALGASDGVAPEPSIWQRLDGSAPRITTEPTYRAPARSGPPLFPGRSPDAVPPPPHRVAAAYAQVAQAASTFTLASWWPRCWAFLIDTLLFGALVVGLTLLAGVGAGMTVSESTTFFASATIPEGIHGAAWLYAVLVAGRLLLGILPALFLWRWNGQTPGKRLLGLRVMRASAEPMTLRVALRREVMGRVVLLQLVTLVTLGVGPLLNYLWPLWDQQRRAGHDLYANTRVVVEASER